MCRRWDPRRILSGGVGNGPPGRADILQASASGFVFVGGCFGFMMLSARLTDERRGHTTSRISKFGWAFARRGGA